MSLAKREIMLLFQHNGEVPRVEEKPSISVKHSMVEKWRNFSKSERLLFFSLLALAYSSNSHPILLLWEKLHHSWTAQAGKPYWALQKGRTISAITWLLSAVLLP